MMCNSAVNLEGGSLTLGGIDTNIIQNVNTNNNNYCKKYVAVTVFLALSGYRRRGH